VTLKRVTYGLSNDASADYAHGRAVEEAVVVAALAGGTFPSDEGFMKQVSVQLIDRITSFAIHARRAAEITGKRGIQISEPKWLNPGGPALETNFWDIINKILHARDMQIVTFEREEKEAFPKLGDRIIARVEVQSDRGDAICFCPYGLVYGYLSQILLTNS
jgi:hypothetical protein